MRYNPETERGITLDQINEQCWGAVARSAGPTEPALCRVWDCTNGRGWITTVQSVPIGRPCVTIA